MKEYMTIHEEERLRVLKQYDILDTADETAYDNLTILAAKLCGAPMAAICLVDEYRQWFKSRIGFEDRQTDRCMSFCTHAILKPEQVMIVPDATKDFRFCDSELVTDEPHIRFYAGVSLVNPDGFPLGALSIMDTVPRELTGSQIESLVALARQVEDQLELRRSRMIIQTQADFLVEAREAAAAANSVKRTFLSNITHEFRTPINGIMGVSSLLSSTEMSNQQKQFVDVIEQSAGGLLNVLSNIIDFSTNELGGTATRLAKMNTIGLVEEVATMMRPMAVAKKLNFHFSTDDNLPRTLMGDALKIQQILTNLVGNALKFTAEGYVGVRVKLIGEKHGGAVIRFEVKDTGVGIPDEMRMRIFEEFMQVEQGADRNFSGTGLGLTICRQLARQMGTQINLLSEEGVGSTFWFDVVMPYEVALVEPSDEQISKSTAPSQGRVLVVDESEVSSMVLASMLEAKGYEVAKVSHSDDAVRMVRQSRFDLIFMDVKVPDMDGINATRTIRHMQFPACMTPIIGMSATVLKEHEVLCKSVGMNEMICKPLSDKLVNLALDRWLNRSMSSASCYADEKPSSLLRDAVVVPELPVSAAQSAPLESIAVY